MTPREVFGCLGAAAFLVMLATAPGVMLCLMVFFAFVWALVYCVFALATNEWRPKDMRGKL